MKYNERGEELPDPTPMEVPLKFRPAIGEVQRLKALIREVVSEAASDHGEESFEEANDFDVGDEEPTSRYEVMEDDQQFQQFVQHGDVDDDRKREYLTRRHTRSRVESGRDGNAGKGNPTGGTGPKETDKSGGRPEGRPEPPGVGSANAAGNTVFGE